MNTTLMNRDFKWRIVRLPHEKQAPFTVDEFKKSVDKAISLLPNDLEVQEIVIESEDVQVSGEERRLETIIYWKELRRIP